MLSRCDLSAFMKLVAIVPDLLGRIKSPDNLERSLRVPVTGERKTVAWRQRRVAVGFNPQPNGTTMDKLCLAGKGESATLV